MEWVKIFENHISDKRLESEYIKKPYNSPTKNHTTQRPWAETLNRPFSKDDMCISQPSVVITNN
jgi:hypothetical protein